MSDDQRKQFEADVERIVHDVLQKSMRKLMLSVWLLILGSVGALIASGVAWGSLTEKVAANEKNDDRHHSDSNVHMTETTKMSVFVTRAEWSTVMSNQTENIKQVQSAVNRLETKIDNKL